MTLEGALMSALASVTSALVFVVSILWKRSERCETDRYALRKEIEKIKVEYGRAVGQLEIYHRCPVGECPFQDNEDRKERIVSEWLKSQQAKQALIIIGLVTTLVFTGGCAGRQKALASPSFVRPSSAPVKQAVTKVQENVAKATQLAKAVDTSIGKAKESVAKLEAVTVENPGVEPILVELRLQLDSAKTEVDALTTQLLEARASTEAASTRIVELDAKVQEQTSTLNDFADRNNRLTADNAKLTEDRDRWRKMTMHWRLIALTAAAAIALYFFRQPLFFAARKLIGLP